MLKYAVILAVLVAAAYAGEITITECNNGGPRPSWMSIEGCSLTECTIRSNVTTGLTAQIVAGYDATELTTTLRAFLLGIDLGPQEIPDEIADGCQAVVGGCPIAINQVVDVDTAFSVVNPVSATLPVTIEVQIVNENANIVMCGRTNINFG